ncbi:hypothetical protein BP00DRAFT_167557 [Aspergillus indologenus CBS 114.80]|uniref:Uncharacterized protein n=1 Tax=Aspergillus indologenus CBS 114.80 TaxID=1450541 RepID=A0A2V5I4K4_9EURO|nr:hypothetical protein BP00DRAFT_167557 [Aspergillus indologenus CBS 114.80]
MSWVAVYNITTRDALAAVGCEIRGPLCQNVVLCLKLAWLPDHESLPSSVEVMEHQWYVVAAGVCAYWAGNKAGWPALGVGPVFRSMDCRDHTLFQICPSVAKEGRGVKSGSLDDFDPGERGLDLCVRGGPGRGRCLGYGCCALTFFSVECFSFSSRNEDRDVEYERG